MGCAYLRSYSKHQSAPPDQDQASRKQKQKQAQATSRANHGSHQVSLIVIVFVCFFCGPQTMAMTRLHFVSFVVFVQCMFQQVVSVDRSKFRTCDQTAFCRRNRSPRDVLPSYHVMKESIKPQGEDGNGISLLLEGEHSEAPQYKLDIKFYDSGVSRIQVIICLV